MGVRTNFKLRLVLSGALLSLLAQTAAAVEIYRTGSSIDITTQTSQYICLAGGSSDDDWADGWRATLSRSGGGDVVVIRASGSRGEYEEWIFEDPSQHGFRKVNSVTTISTFGREDAEREDVEQLIQNAEMIFFAGGDQSRYVDWYAGTRLERAVNYAMNVRGVPVGGTSAGMAVLSGLSYAAHYSSPTGDDVVSWIDVLRDPTAVFVDVVRSFLRTPFLENVIADTHFSERERHGRLAGFMARAVATGMTSLEQVRGIGSDEGTAVCFDSSGVAEVHGVGNAYFLRANAAIERFEPGRALHWVGERKAIRAYVISGRTSEAEFNLQTWAGSGGIEQFWYVDGSNDSLPVLVEY